jgi:hypothetical protein
MADDREMSVQEFKLHEIRKEIDALIQKVGALKSDEGFKPAGRETALSYTHLQEAKMWLGQALGSLGSVLPQQYADKA